MNRIDAIILAGGLGKRLRGVVKDVPKPMANVRGRPFLAHIIDRLRQQGFSRVIISTGHMSGSVEEYFKKDPLDMKIDFSREDRPLGTGGAIKKALTLANGDSALVLNGDTFFKIDLSALKDLHVRSGADVSLALKPVPSCERYGRVTLNSDMEVTGFLEKGSKDKGLINAGVYLLKKDILNDMPEVFSFETDFLPKNIGRLKIAGFPFDGYFIDIGVPEDYLRARQEFEFASSN